MVNVRIIDNRHRCGFRIKRFSEEEVTADIVKFVESNPKVFDATVNGLWMTREKFLQKYNDLVEV